MQEKHLKPLLVVKKMAGYGIGIGIAIFLFSILASDYNRDYLLSTSGIAIMIASMIVFGFGMSLSLMEEYTDNCRGKSKSSY